MVDKNFRLAENKKIDCFYVCEHVDYHSVIDEQASGDYEHRVNNNKNLLSVKTLRSARCLFLFCWRARILQIAT